MGHGSVLVRMSVAIDGSSRLMLDEDRDRLQVLATIVGGRPIAASTFRHVKVAADDWQRGDKALASLRLIFADLPRAQTAADADRLALAEHLLDCGMAPAELMKALALDTEGIVIGKYSPDQPRVPAGHGRQSGQFGSSGGNRAAPPTVARPDAALLAPVGSVPAAPIPEAIVGAASRLAGPLAFIVAMVIPTPNSGGVDEGTLPEMPDVRFRKDGPEGTLKLTTNAPNGSEVTVVAHNNVGTYIDARTGQALGQDLGSSISLDKPAIRDAIDAAITGNEDPEHKPKAATDDPEVCPAPEKDRGHGAKERSLDYEDDVHLRVNPLDPIERGYAVRVWDPSTGKYIFVDDCYRSHGDLVDGDMRPGDLAEAKGPGYDWVFSQSFGKKAMEDLVYDAGRQLSAADARGVRLKMYFAEKGAADLVRQRFGYDQDLSRIVVSHMPPRKGR